MLTNSEVIRVLKSQYSTASFGNIQPFHQGYSNIGDYTPADFNNLCYDSGARVWKNFFYGTIFVSWYYKDDDSSGASCIASRPKILSAATSNIIEYVLNQRLIGGQNYVSSSQTRGPVFIAKLDTGLNSAVLCITLDGILIPIL